MRSISPYLVVVIAAFLLVGCGERVPVGNSEYVLVTPANLSMDGHPGTSLRYQGRQVWPNVHPGYFNNAVGAFYRDHVFVFVGGVPSKDGYDHSKGPQVFAIHDAASPVLISEHAFHLPLTNSYYVERITPIQNGFRIEIKFWAWSKRDGSVTNEISWADIARWTREAESSSIEQVTPFGTYRVLR